MQGRRRPEGGQMQRKREVALSKSLSFFLRHGAAKHGLPMQEDGWIAVDHLLPLPQLKRENLTVEEVKYIVANNDKQRFALKEEDGVLYIRANQGHTMKDIKVDMTPITLDNHTNYPTVVHGTYRAAWASIKATGLSRMQRNHIHFAKGILGSENVISGMRATCDVLIYIDLEQALKDGIEFHESANGVILTGGVDGTLAPKYFKKVTDRNGAAIPL
ncbi:2'-phosphotransferase [Balamuthia mandrillaris]